MQANPPSYRTDRDDFFITITVAFEVQFQRTVVTRVTSPGVEIPSDVDSRFVGEIWPFYGGAINTR